MAARPILLALVWHMHQPSYFHAPTGRALLPWVRLHATKDYRDMADRLRSYPRVHCTFNLTPVLLDQIERIAAGEEDEALRLARLLPMELTPADRAAVLRDFFSVHRERMLEPRPRYRELQRRASEERSGGPPLSEAEMRDLQTWFHLAWIDPIYAAEEPIRSIIAKGEGFTEEEKRAVLAFGIELTGSVIGAYREAVIAGQIELATSAHHHPILPLLIDSSAPREAASVIDLLQPPFCFPDDAEGELKSARASHARRFGALPRGTWPPEGAVNDASLEMIRAQGFAWAASDEAVLRHALGARDGEARDWPAPLYRPYRVETPAGPLAMVFRDRALSDRIGFVYQRWGAEDAAEDFVEQIRSAAANARGSGPALVTVILDGENCWEGYEEDGGPFLAALYERLSGHPSIEAVTVAEALERMPPKEVLPHVPVGSWIRDDLGIWIGSSEKNAAWAALRDARTLLGQKASAVPREAWEAIHAAEGSDWFWWYGEDHQSDHKDTFDELFRARLRAVYEAMGLEPPSKLQRSLREAGVVAEADAEWAGASRYDATAAEGAMHRVTGWIELVRWRVANGEVLVRVDGNRDVMGAGATLVVRASDGGEAARVPIGDSGAPLVARIRLDQLGPDAAFRVELERHGKVEERAPREGEFHAPAAIKSPGSPRGSA
ncbi:MAG TPA: glycoside hydrolase family 57 protein [Candidatus Eisenbacteria bacterium]|jgi:alpha-amylase/alpha-mannosidase (GH57 family)|nr:glycoside hydrolase family 57 protein [Candidatus Eisenbacteria bacterium]